MILLKQICLEVEKRCSSVDRLSIDDTDFIIGRTANSDDTSIYLVLDSLEGRECVGHWLWECSIYVPFFKRLQMIYPTLKLLMNGYKRYKEQFCEILGVDKSYIEYESDIDVYRPTVAGRDISAELYYPLCKEYTVIVPRYTYLLLLSICEDSEFRDLFRKMKELFPLTPAITKSVSCIYMIRSNTSDTYARGSGIRDFLNLNDVVNTVKSYSIPIYDVKDFTSLREQISVVERAKVIIVEHGSAWFINAILFARGAHIIVLNKLPIGCIELEDQLSIESGNTYEFIESSLDWRNIVIPLDKLDRAITKSVKGVDI